VFVKHSRSTTGSKAGLDTLSTPTGHAVCSDQTRRIIELTAALEAARLALARVYANGCKRSDGDVTTALIHAGEVLLSGPEARP
jgi:hypothetical protein